MAAGTTAAAAGGYPLRLHQVRVPKAWLDYNGHMTEFRYLQVLGDATDAFLIHAGLGPDYRATGRSAYPVETHIRHLAEVRAGLLSSLFPALSVTRFDAAQIDDHLPPTHAPAVVITLTAMAGCS